MTRTTRECLRGAAPVLGAVFLGTLIGVLVSLRLPGMGHVTLRIEMALSLPGPSRGEVFWGGSSGNFAGERRVAFDVAPGRGVYEVELPAPVGRVRIDPSAAPGSIEIRSIVVRRWGWSLFTRAWGGARSFEGWEPGNDVRGFEARDGVLLMESTGQDPSFASTRALDGGLRFLVAHAVLGFGAGFGSILVALAALPRARGRFRAGLSDARALVARWSRVCAQSAAILALGLGLSEVAMRVYHHFRPVFVFPSEGTNRFRGQPFAPDYGYGFHLNSHGFKDVEFEREKRAGTVRILGLGDSFAFGVVPYDSNYLTLLEQDLARAAPPAEVINMGIPAIGPRGYLEVLVNEGLPLHADMVLLSFFMGNDFWDEEPPPPRSYLFAFARYLLAPKPKGVPIHGPVPYVDDAATFEPAKYLQLERERAAIFRRSNHVLGDALPSTHDRLLRIKRVCDVEGLELLVVLIPDELQVDQELQAQVVDSFAAPAGEFDFTQANRRLEMELKGLGIRYLDLMGPFQESGHSKRLYKPRDSHWNISGNRLGADLIRNELLRGDTKFWPRPRD